MPKYVWTPEMDKSLIKYVSRSYTMSQIGKILGVSKNSVIGRVFRLRKRGEM